MFNPLGVVLAVIDAAQDAAASLRRLVGVANLPAPVQPTRRPRPARPPGSTTCPTASTPSSGRGHPLTVTQAQQLAPARVALTRAPVVVLAEATAVAGSVGALAAGAGCYATLWRAWSAARPADPPPAAPR